tara:strand:+ start:431 stop:595 length:165 start_codon:yes stop_codon:yes gene_type:complete
MIDIEQEILNAYNENILEDEDVLELISEMFNLQEDLALENMVEEIIEEDIRQSV